MSNRICDNCGSDMTLLELRKEYICLKCGHMKKQEEEQKEENEINNGNKINSQ